MHGNRSPWLDNAKGMLVLLVVWGHLIEQAAFVGGLSAGVYGAIYLFHMPAFAMIGGMLTRGTAGGMPTARGSWRIVRVLIVFQILYGLFLSRTAPGLLGGALAPNWLLWFLLSLLFWRTMAPVFQGLRFPVVTAIGVALAAGYVDVIGYELSLSRTLVFFPAFLFGHLHGRDIVARARVARRASAWAFLGLMGVAVLGFWGSEGLPVLYGSRSYALLPDTALAPVVVRFMLIGAGLMGSVLFLALVSARAGRLARVGRQSLVVYVTHGFAVVLYWSAGAHAVLGSGVIFLAFSLIVAVALTGVAMRAGEQLHKWSFALGKHRFHRSRILNDPR